MAETKKAIVAKEEEVPKTTEELRALLKRTRAGDESTVPVVRKLLQNPAYIGVFGGDLAEQVISSFTKAMGGESVSFREAVFKKLELLRTELLGDNPTPVERLLVERIAACWLQVQDAELRAAQGQKDATYKQLEFYQRRMDATNKRYLSAVKTLALVRKLAVPALQVNIAKRQVNVVVPALGSATAVSAEPGVRG